MRKPKPRVVWDPAPPDEPPPRKVDVWLLGVSQLSPDALRYLLRTFPLRVPNLLQARRLLCDGKEHLLLRGEYEHLAVSLMEEASSLGIPLELRPSGAGSGC